MQVRPPQLCTDAAPQWYALRSMDLPTERKSRIRARTLAVLLLMLGATMGGYAALAFAPLVPGARVLAVAPQSTLAPGRVPGETRWKWTASRPCSSSRAA